VSTDEIYATPRQVADIGDCYFYHTMEIPRHGLVEGEWDLRVGVKDYLGHVNFSNKRVLEFGTASGFLCLAMESAGAEVVAYDLSDRDAWDLVPFSGYDDRSAAEQWSAHIRRLNNGFWFNHRASNSRARVVYGSIYSVPEAIGPVDIAVYGSILLHLRDPFYALQNGLRLTRETVVITDVLPKGDEPLRFPRLAKWLTRRLYKRRQNIIQFLPDYRTRQPKETWWLLSPEIIVEFIGVLGFERTDISYHQQLYKGQPVDLFTVVGHRARKLSNIEAVPPTLPTGTHSAG
jgi:hypothetical protein